MAESYVSNAERRRVRRMLNNISLIGRLTADPELRTTPTGSSVISFCLAVQRDYVKQGEERQADFIDCVAWNQTAEIINRFMHKGSSLAVTGRLQTRTYEDREGNKRKVSEVNVQNVSFIDKKSEPMDEPIASDDDDLPFD